MTVLLFDGIADAGVYEYQADIQTGADRLAANGNITTVNVEVGKTYNLQVAADACRSIAVITSNGSSPLSGMSQSLHGWTVK